MLKLYIVATPIGNLKDISFRAIETLKNVDLVLCEDTRVAKKLLDCYEISTPTVSYYQHSKQKKIEYILGQLKDGRDLALISDAGTPLISDPGANLIGFLLERLPDLRVIPIPGPSALISALSVSGFSADKFIFLGFPPAKKKRKKFFEEVANSKYTVVFYESCHRILKTLEEFSVILSVSEESRRKQIVVCRELTKKFETIYRGDIGEVIEKIEKDKIKGEFVVVVKGLSKV